MPELVKKKRVDGTQFLPKEFSWGNELLASLVVFLVALPLCMGIALASGVPPALGLIGGVIGGLIVGLISGSPLQVSGPAAGLAVIVWEVVQKHGIEGMATALVLSGIIQIAAGAFKFGQVFRAITPAVIYGMLAGIGVLIFASQFHMMVDDSPRSNGVQNLMSIPEAIYKGVSPDVGDRAHHLAALVGLLTIGSLLLWKRFHPKRLSLVPAPLVAVIVGSGAAALFQFPVLYVSIPDNMLETIRIFQFDDLLRFKDASLVVSAVTIAFVASAETLLSASAVDQMHNGVRTNYDRELLAQGVGNTLCGMLGALPMTGVIVRSSANVLAGAKTRLSTIFHGLWILVVVLLFPELLSVIPRATLAAILVYTGFKLVDLKQVRILQQYGRFPLIIYFVTLIGIVATDLLTGVIIGVVLSLIKVLWAASHLEIEIKHDLQANRVELTLLGSATFLRLPQLAEALDDVPQGAELHVLLHKLRYIDHACIELLANWEKQRKAQGGTLVMERDDLLDRCLDSSVGRQYVP